MEINIPVGVKGEEKKNVALTDTASAYGSGLAEVFATPAMIAFMEQTAYKSIEPHLPQGYSSVGIGLNNVLHKKATLPQKEVVCHSEVVKVDGKKITFSIQVFEGDIEVGCAEHTRYIINSEEFMKNIRSLS